MPKFRYNGAENCRVGAGLVKPGAILELDAPPNKHFELVREMSARSAKGGKSKTRSDATAAEKGDD